MENDSSGNLYEFSIYSTAIGAKLLSWVEEDEEEVLNTIELLKNKCAGKGSAVYTHGETPGAMPDPSIFGIGTKAFSEGHVFWDVELMEELS